MAKKAQQGTVKQSTFIFNMGDRVRDVVTRFEGIVVSRHEYWTGCNHYSIEGKASDTGKAAYENFDEQRLELRKPAAVTLAREYEQQVESPRRTSPGAPAAARAPMRGA